MDKNTLLIFLALVFGAVFLLTQTIVVPTFGTRWLLPRLPAFQRAHPHVLVFPAALLALLILCLNHLGDGLRDALDPRQP